jgi:methionine salvage enolase-phosphatase E1
MQYFEHHFDTKIGSKLKSDSYVSIAKELNVDPSLILFVSDNVKGMFLF